jgi:hypothetical protein
MDDFYDEMKNVIEGPLHQSFIFWEFDGQITKFWSKGLAF